MLSSMWAPRFEVVHQHAANRWSVPVREMGQITKIQQCLLLYYTSTQAEYDGTDTEIASHRAKPKIYSTIIHRKASKTNNQSAFSCAGAAAAQPNQPPLVARRGAGARIVPARSLSASLGTSTSSKFVPLPTRPRSPLADSADDVRLCDGGIETGSGPSPSRSYPLDASLPELALLAPAGAKPPWRWRSAVPPATIAGP
jgi:hypothetical protein